MFATSEHGCRSVDKISFLPISTQENYSLPQLTTSEFERLAGAYATDASNTFHELKVQRDFHFMEFSDIYLFILVYSLQSLLENSASSVTAPYVDYSAQWKPYLTMLSGLVPSLAENGASVILASQLGGTVFLSSRIDSHLRQPSLVFIRWFHEEPSRFLLTNLR